MRSSKRDDEAEARISRVPHVKRGVGALTIALCGVLVLTACGGSGGAQGNDNEAEYTLKIADYVPTGHPYEEEGASYFMDRATELTGGRVQFDYFPAEQLGKVTEFIDLAQSGVTDIALVAPAYRPDKLILSGVGDLPAMHEDACDGALAVAKLTQEGGILYEEEFAPQDIRPLVVGVTPSYDVMTTDAPVNGLSDVEGLKLRSSGGTIDRTVEAIGAAAVPIEGPEMYEAMQRGTVDGTVISPVSTKPYKLDELINYGTVGAQLGSFTFTYSISENKWDTLPSDIQDALLKAGRETNQNLCEALNKENKETLSEMKQKGAKFYTLAPEEQERWQDTVQPVREQWIEDMEKEGLPGEQAMQAMSEAVETVSKK